MPITGIVALLQKLWTFIGNLWSFCRFVLGWLNTLSFSVAILLLTPLLGRRRVWVWMAPWWAKTTLAILGVQVDVVNPQYLQLPAIYICNHSSLLDVVVLPSILPAKTRFIAKRELLWVPLWGLAFACGGAFFIDRKNFLAAKARLALLAETLPKHWSVMVFPEGTRSVSGQILPLKKGAFHLALQTGLPVVALGIAGTERCAPLGHWLVRGGKVKVVVQQPLVTQSLTTVDATTLSQQAQTQLQQAVAESRQRLI